jgi:hypothetical protein
MKHQYALIYIYIVASKWSRNHYISNKYNIVQYYHLRYISFETAHLRNYTVLLSHPAWGWLELAMTWPWGRERELDRRPFSLSFQGYRLLIGRPVVKGRGLGKLTEVSWALLKPKAVTLRLVYVGFGAREIWVWSALPVWRSPASQPRRAAQTFGYVSKTGFDFGVQDSGWNLVGLPGVWLAGGVPVHCGVDVEFRRAGFRGWLLYVCACVFYVESLWWFIL